MTWGTLVLGIVLVVFLVWLSARVIRAVPVPASAAGAFDLSMKLIVASLLAVGAFIGTFPPICAVATPLWARLGRVLDSTVAGTVEEKSSTTAPAQLVPQVSTPTSTGGSAPPTPTRAPNSVVRPQSPKYDSTMGKVSVQDAPAAPYELVIYWDGGTNPHPAGLHIGPVKESNIGKDAKNIRVQFSLPDNSVVTELVPVP